MSTELNQEGTTRIVTLHQGATNIEVKPKSEISTLISFKSPAHPGKVCIKEILGLWEIHSVSGNELTLVNYDEVIPANYGNQESRI